jgi:hexaprenyl-diphosphate synthase
MFANAAPSPIGIDPLQSVAKELKFLTGNIQQLLGSGHPMLDTVAKYYTQSEGKYVRPMLVLLMSQATALTLKHDRSTPTVLDVDTPMSPSTVLADSNPESPLTSPPVVEDVSDTSVLPSQRRLAEITELIHTASLLHDDVIDNSISRRSAPSANIQFGNKMAVLAGDFMLGRASVALARLRDPEVTELLATVIANLIEGEFMQLKNTASDEKHPAYSQETMEYYLQKTYLKSASLISKSTRAAAILGNCSPDVVEAAYSYGKNLGLAFQLVDDMLDYTVSGAELGKPAGADLELGLATAPLLFAWKDNKELGTLVGRRFAEQGDVKRVSFYNFQHKMPNKLTNRRRTTLSSRAMVSNKLAPWLKIISTRLAKPLLSSRRAMPRLASWTCVQKFCRGESRYIDINIPSLYVMWDEEKCTFTHAPCLERCLQKWLTAHTRQRRLSKIFSYWFGLQRASILLRKTTTLQQRKDKRNRAAECTT